MKKKNKIKTNLKRGLEKKKEEKKRNYKDALNRKGVANVRNKRFTLASRIFWYTSD